MERPRRGDHVLVARLDSDGDVLLAGPAVRAVAARAERVTVLAGPRGVQAARALPGTAAVEVFRAPWIDPEPEPLDPAYIGAVMARLRSLRVDRALVLTSFHQDPLPMALLLRMAGVPWVGAISEDYPGSLLDLRHRVPDDVHEVERALSLAEAAGYPAPPAPLLEVRRNRSALPAGLPRGYVVIHPGASVPARAWSPVRHAALARALARRGWPLVVTGGPGEAGLTATVAEAAGPGRAVDLGARTSFGALTEVLAGARVVVVGNTGPAHLAAAVGRPVAWLHAPTVPEVRWRPWGVPHVRLAADVPCAGCRARVCPVPGHPCLSCVPVEDVVAAVEHLAGLPSGTGRPVACAS